MEEGRPDTTEREDLEREDHLSDVVGIRNDQSWCTRNGSPDEVPQEEAAEETEGKLGLCFPRMTKGTTKDEAEDECVDPEHDERCQEGPEDTEEGPPVTLLNLPPGELDDEVPMTGEVSQNSPRGKEIER
jgi:hypothetical protein